MRVGDWKKGRPAGKTYAGGSRGLQMLASQHARQSETVHREGSKKVEAEEPREDSGQSSGKKRRVENGEEGTLMETPTTPATAATNTKKEPASPYNASRLRLDGLLEEIFNETNPTPPRSDYSSGKDGDSGKSPTSVTSSKTIRPIIDHDENLVEGIDSDSGELLVEEETPAEAKARKQRQIENNLAAKSFIGIVVLLLRVTFLCFPIIWSLMGIVGIVTANRTCHPFLGSPLREQGYGI
jgi:hypothetical protein